MRRLSPPGGVGGRPIRNDEGRRLIGHSADAPAPLYPPAARPGGPVSAWAASAERMKTIWAVLEPPPAWPLSVACGETENHMHIV